MAWERKKEKRVVSKPAVSRRMSFDLTLSSPGLPRPTYFPYENGNMGAQIEENQISADLFNSRARSVRIIQSLPATVFFLSFFFFFFSIEFHVLGKIIFYLSGFEVIEDFTKKGATQLVGTSVKKF